MLKLKDILQEKSNDPKKVFQNIAFGSSSGVTDDNEDGDSEALIARILALQGDPTEEERNTEEEGKILDYFQQWVISSSGTVADAIYGYKALIKRAMQAFPTIFKPETPTGTPVYRLITASTKDFVKVIQKAKIEDFEQIKLPQDTRDDVLFYKYKKPVTYRPHRQVQSWTTEKGILRAFPEGSVLISTQDDDYMMNQKFMSAVYGFGDERELLHFNKTYKSKVYIAIPETVFDEIRSDDYYDGIE